MNTFQRLKEHLWEERFYKWICHDPVIERVNKNLERLKANLKGENLKEELHFDYQPNCPKCNEFKTTTK